jgi:LssY-like putative type I secretion system component LssY
MERARARTGILGDLRALAARAGLAALLGACAVAAGCARYRPAPIDLGALAAGAVTETREGLTVSAVVPDDDEAARLFGVPLADHDIQPVGLVITNRTDRPYWFTPLALDPDYFTPIEAANRARYFLRRSANRRMRRHFLESAIGAYVGPGERISGFVYTKLSRGLKPVHVLLLGSHRVVQFYFTIRVDNVAADYRAVDPEKLYPGGEIRDVSEAELLAAIEALPCCATTEDGRGLEDPLNFVLVGEGNEILPSLVRSGWHVSEVLRRASALETFRSYFFSVLYPYAPISPIYLFGREQDLALQKARETARQRNHLRIWRAPLRCEGNPVWVGQISRDVGLRLSWKGVVAHEVDPDVDEDRYYLLQDMLRSQGVERFGWAAGVGAAPPSKPHRMSDGSPFFTDGLRLVLWLRRGPIPLDQIRALDWRKPPPPESRAVRGDP